VNLGPSDVSDNRTPRIVALVGPSASGKSAVATELALLLEGEVVSVDSMQVYRGMDIGTAKPTATDQARVRHHLIDVVDLTVGFDAAAFRAAAIPVIDAILERQKTAILCGGTGFYFGALFRGLGTAPASSSELRAEFEKKSTASLLDELRRCDPAAYDAIDRQNRRRVIRAVEVFRLTGQPFSQQRPRPPTPGARHPAENESAWRTFGLLRSADDLRARIGARVDAMLRQGLVDETQRLLAAGLDQNQTALQAIGYRQTVEYLQGERSLEATRELIKSRTRQFARRQMTWFRRKMNVTWISVDSTEPAAETARRIARSLPPGEGENPSNPGS
jgi:tRNA dimethylallyltransferase